jgi:hypothetical protein
MTDSVERARASTAGPELGPLTSLDGSWQIASWFLLRAAGFAFDTLASLRQPDAYVLLSDALDDEAKGRPANWTSVNAALLAATEDCIVTLLDLARSDAFREAMLLSNPAQFPVFDRWLQSDIDPSALRAKDRKRIRTMIMYAQRFAAKNDTHSFFGPIAWGRLDPDGQSLALPPAPSPDGLRRFVFFSHWAARAIADRMASEDDVIGALVPRKPPYLFEGPPGTYRLVDFLARPPSVRNVDASSFDADGRAIFDLVDGQRTVNSIALIAESAGTVTATTVRRTLATLRALEQIGVIELDVAIPVGAADPIPALRGVIDRLTGLAKARWTEQLDALEEQRRLLETASGFDGRRSAHDRLSELVSRIGSVPSTRLPGEFYADRSVAFEDCLLPWKDFSIGRPLTDIVVEDLPPILDTLMLLPRRLQRAHRQAIRSWFVRSFGEGSDVPLDVVIDRAHDDPDLAPSVRDRERSVRDEHVPITDVLLANQRESRLNLPLSWAIDQSADAHGWVASSVDLMLISDPSDARSDAVMLSEVHAYHDLLLSGGSPAALHPDPESLSNEVDRIHRGLGGPRICDIALRHWAKSMICARSEIPQIEFVETADREVRIQASGLRVRDVNGALLLWAPELGSVSPSRPPVDEWEDEPETIFGAVVGPRALTMSDLFGPLLETADHVPRLQIGRIIVHRETWRLAPPDWPAWRGYDVEAQRRVWRLKRDAGLPDVVFAKFAEEPKPVCVDFRNPLLVDTFARMVRTTTRTILITEMLPAESDLWLRGAGGVRPCEFRLSIYRRES